MGRRRSTYLEREVQQQRDDQPDADHDRASNGVEVATTALVDQALSPHVDTVAPGTGENGDESVNESQATRDVVVGAGGVVETETQRAKENTDVLPLDESTLVCEPDLGFHLDGACVLDPERGLFNARRELGLAACSRVLGCAEGWEKVGDPRSGRGLCCGVCSTIMAVTLGLEESECGLARRVRCISLQKDLSSDFGARVVPPWSR